MGCRNVQEDCGPERGGFRGEDGEAVAKSNHGQWLPGPLPATSVQLWRVAPAGGDKAEAIQALPSISPRCHLRGGKEMVKNPD